MGSFERYISFIFITCVTAAIRAEPCKRFRSCCLRKYLDEATASIDPENEHLIQQVISELTKGKTIITIAHRLATIRNADQILVVDDGRIAECGTHEELIAQGGIYKRFTAIRQQAEGWKL